MKKIRKKIFLWQGLDLHEQFQEGSVRAVSKEEAYFLLMERNIELISIKKQFSFFLFQKPITQKHVMDFLRKLTLLLENHIPLEKALRLCVSSEKKSLFSSVINNILQCIEKGLSFSEALHEEHALFDASLIHFIQFGEQTGYLLPILHKILTLHEHLETSKKKIKKALFYPCALLLISFLMVAGMLFFILPQFQQIFSEFGAPLPKSTEIVFNITLLLKQWGLFLFIFFIFLFFCIRSFYQKNISFQKKIHHLYLRIPFLSSLLNHTYQSRFYYLLATSLTSNLPMVHALLLLRKHFKHHSYATACQTLYHSILEGESLHQSLLKTHLFEKIDCHLIAMAEESGQLTSMLEHLSHQHQQQLDGLLDLLGNLLEPCMMIFIGFLIGGLIIILYLPIFNVGAVIS